MLHGEDRDCSWPSVHCGYLRGVERDGDALYGEDPRRGTSGAGSTERLLLTVSYTCTGFADLEVGVYQEQTDAFASTGSATVPVPCTGKWETVTMGLGPPSPSVPAFELGRATAFANLRHSGDIVSRQRNIRIVS